MGKVKGTNGEGPKIRAGPSPAKLLFKAMGAIMTGEGQGLEIGPSPNDGVTFPVLPLSHPLTERKAEMPDQVGHDEA